MVQLNPALDGMAGTRRARGIPAAHHSSRSSGVLAGLKKREIALCFGDASPQGTSASLTRLEAGRVAGIAVPAVCTNDNPRPGVRRCLRQIAE
jgi:hypothetical protein